MSYPLRRLFSPFSLLFNILLTLPSVARGSSVLAKSVNTTRIDQNKNLVKLDDSDMATIAKYTAELEKNKAFVRYVYPPFGVDFGFPDKS